MLTRMPVAGYTGTCEAIRDADLTDASRTIQQPALVLCGAEDASTPPDLVRGLTDILPDVRYTEIENAGHLPCIENPQAVSAAIQTFLKDVL
jgi:pimeloyl-ACP methyl ester carboxylesterase